MKNFNNKVVVITGAGSGMGRDMAIQFSNQGARLALNDYKEAGLLETVQLLKTGTEVYQEIFDVSNREAVFSFADNVLQHYHQVDVLINNAGVAIAKLDTDEVSVEEYEWIIGINLWGVIYGSLAFLPHLRKQPEASLVNISSVFGLTGIPGQGPYCTTKFAVRGFTDSLAIEEQQNGSSVVVSSVHPGGIKTNIARSALKAGNDPKTIQKFEKNFITTSKKAANIIIEGIQKKKNRILVGPDAKLIYLLTKLPSFFMRLLVLRTLKKTEG